MDNNRVASLITAGALFIYTVMIRKPSFESAIILLLYLLLSLSLVWFGEAYGRFIGIHFGDVFSPTVTKTSPASIIRFLGWFLIFLPILFLLGNRIL